MKVSQIHVPVEIITISWKKNVVCTKVICSLSNISNQFYIKLLHINAVFTACYIKKKMITLNGNEGLFDFIIIISISQNIFVPIFVSGEIAMYQLQLYLGEENLTGRLHCMHTFNNSRCIFEKWTRICIIRSVTIKENL